VSSVPAWCSGCARITCGSTYSRPPSACWARYLRQVSKKKSRAWSRDGLNILFFLLRLAAKFAQVADQTLGAAGLAREADIATVQDQPVMGVAQEFRRNELEQLVLDRARILSRRDPGPVCDAEYVRVDRDGRLSKRRIQHYVRRLAADAGQALERFARGRDFAAVMRCQQAAPR